MNFYNLLSNNRFINNVLIATGYDAKLQMAAKQWKLFNYNSDKSIQENAGFSHKPDVEKALNIIKNKLQLTLSHHIKEKTNVLDFGCGPGIYMDLLKEKYTIEGIDVSEEMIITAKKTLPFNQLYLGNFLLTNFSKTYDAIYSISVLEYVPVSKISDFFKKSASLLNTNGIIFIQYPHALCKADLSYPDRNYICYSPALLNKIASNYFTIIENKQSFDERETCIYDKTPYPTSSKIVTNGYLLIAQKR